MTDESSQLDDSDVLQEAFLEVSQRLEEYQRDPVMPFFLWLRRITGQKLIQVQRRHHRENSSTTPTHRRQIRRILLTTRPIPLLNRLLEH